MRKPVKPLFTKENIIAKYIAKQNKAAAEKKAAQPKTFLNFDVKVTDNKKRKKKEPEVYVNIPDSFFNSMKKPDMTRFFGPPAPKTIAPEPALPIPPSSYFTHNPNFTFGSVESRIFKPKVVSTPIEMPKPMFSDPCDIQSFWKPNRLSLFEQMPSKADTKKKKFLAMVESTATKIDKTCFGNEEDPLISMKARISELFEAALLEPRRMNETLWSMAESVVESVVITPPPRPSQKMDFLKARPPPVPVFPPTPLASPVIESKKIRLSSPPVNVDQTEDIFNWTEDHSPMLQLDLDDLFSSPSSNCPLDFFNFDTPKNVELFDADGSLWLPLDTPNHNKDIKATPVQGNIDDLLAFTHDPDFKMDWQGHEKRNNEEFDCTTALFESPPGPKRQLKQETRHKSQSDWPTQHNTYRKVQHDGRHESQHDGHHQHDGHRQTQHEGRRGSQYDGHRQHDGQRQTQQPGRSPQCQPYPQCQPEQSSYRPTEATTYRPQPKQQSQRTQTDDPITDFSHRFPNTTLSTYKWTPRIGSTSFESDTTIRPHFLVEPRPIWRKSHNFLKDFM